MASNADAEKIITGVLRERLGKNGFSRSDVVFDVDFDGEKIIRVTAHVEKPVANVDELFDSVYEIREKLLKSDDERFVYLRQDYPGADDDGNSSASGGAH